MQIKTSELTGPALDWAVEFAKGTHWSSNGYFVFKNPDGTTRIFERKPEWRYSTDWSQGGPIIEREHINLVRCNPFYFPKKNKQGNYFGPYIRANLDGSSEYGPTYLIAAMRCYVSSKLGDIVEIPDALALNQTN